MKLLIITQAIDVNHPVLGFFCRWVEEFAQHVEHVHVIALHTGAYTLPKNVTVHSLGKENQQSTINNQHFIAKIKSKFQHAFTFYLLTFTLQKQYDAVFVHMNPEYVVLTGWWWRLVGKKVSLWYTHKSVDMKLRIATWFATHVFTASKESFRLHTRKLQVMGHGIDTAFWTTDSSVVRAHHALSVGRLMRSKRHDLAIRFAHEKGMALRIAGEGSEREVLEETARAWKVPVTFLGALTKEQLRAEYQSAAVLVHRSETGSLDKVVLEAAACGCPVDSSDPAIASLPLSPEYVAREHALSSLIPRIVSILE